MKNQRMFIVVLLLIIAIMISFFVGLNIGKKSTKLVYITTSGKTTSFSVKGSYNANIIGKIKNISKDFVTIENQQGEVTFPLQTNFSILTFENNASSSSDTTKDKQIFPSKKTVPLSAVKIGQRVSAEISLSEKEISIKTIYITSDILNK